MPLYGRSYFGLVFLSGGVTEAAGNGIRDNYPSGTNFISNGQRNATAEVRFDGAPISAPEQGEGGNSNVYYTPSVEVIQEFKVENNSFSAEYGNNGGTVLNIMMKQGGNRIPRQRLVVRPARRVGCQRLFQQSGRHREAAAHSQPIWRRHLRPHQEEQNLLPFRLSSGRTTSAPRKLSPPCRRTCSAAEIFRKPTRSTKTAIWRR